MVFDAGRLSKKDRLGIPLDQFHFRWFIITLAE